VKNGRFQLTIASFAHNEKLLASLSESFRDFNVTIQAAYVRPGESRKQDHIDACVLRLTDDCVRWLKRSSWFVPRRTVVYGMGSAKELSRFMNLGVNALLETDDHSSVHAAVQSTQMLLSRGVGECARVPLAVPVSIESDGRRVSGITLNIGYGGMALRLARNVSLQPEVKLKFVLPDTGWFSLTASPRWYSGRVAGLRFHPSKHEKTLRSWVREYAQLGFGYRVTSD
jgi:hypothetical protein